MDAAVEIENVSFAYEHVPVLEGVNLTIERGRFVSFVGPNGGGKSTLFRLVLGLLKPAGGRIQVLGMRPERARVRIGYVPQDFGFDRRFPMRVADVVRTGCLGEGRGRTAARKSAAEAIDWVGLAHLHNQWFSNLSGGQRQRVLIARALATQPDILLLDEPTASVDAKAGDEILSLLEALQSRLTVLLVTHSAAVASRFLEMIVCVNRTVHVHPATREVDDALMRHICGYERPGNGLAPARQHGGG